VPDVRRDVGERFRTWHLGDDALAVVEDTERRGAPLADARDRHRPCAGVERVLHQLGERLPRIGLRAREPADQLEGIGGAKAAGADVGTGASRHAISP